MVLTNGTSSAVTGWSWGPWALGMTFGSKFPAVPPTQLCIPSEAWVLKALRVRPRLARADPSKPSPCSCHEVRDSHGTNQGTSPSGPPPSFAAFCTLLSLSPKPPGTRSTPCLLHACAFSYCTSLCPVFLFPFISVGNEGEEVFTSLQKAQPRHCRLRDGPPSSPLDSVALP